MIVFLHIPRTGGGSIFQTLKPHIPGRIFPGAVWAEDPGLTHVDWTGYDFAVGHWGASVLDRMPEGTKAFTILRDPVDRVLSHYSFVHEYGYHRDPEFTAWVKQATLREWLDSDYSRYAANNLQTRFLVDRETDDLDRALERLYTFRFTGYFEQGVRANAALLALIMGVQLDTFFHIDIHINNTHNPIRRGDVSKTLIDELIDRNQHDIVLWQSVKEWLTR